MGTCRYPFPLGGLCIETGSCIFCIPIWKWWFTVSIWVLVANRFHWGVSDWKQGALCFESTHGNSDLPFPHGDSLLTVCSIWGSSYGNREPFISNSNMETVIHHFHMGICHFPFPFGEPHMETGSQVSWCSYCRYVDKIHRHNNTTLIDTIPLEWWDLVRLYSYITVFLPLAQYHQLDHSQSLYSIFGGRAEESLTMSFITNISEIYESIYQFYHNDDAFKYPIAQYSGRAESS